MEIRAAALKDIGAVIMLCKELYEEMAILRPDYYTAGRFNGKMLYDAVDDGRQEILVAAEHGAVIGFVRIIERETPSYGPYLLKKYAYIDAIVVDPAFRGIDIGTALINEAKKWAKGRVLEYLELDVPSENEGAVRLVQREAFKPATQTMRCVI